MNWFVIFKKHYLGNIFLSLFACWLIGAGSIKAEHIAPELFTYAELKTLYSHEVLSSGLKNKLNQLLTVPFVDNSQKTDATLPFSRSPKIGEFLRLVCWNIERGLKYDAIEAAFSDESKFAAMLDAEKFPVEGKERREILEQAAALRASDVIVLNEVDFGMRRTDYRNIARDLAERLKMNYAFGVQFIELSPIHFSQESVPANREEKEILEQIKVDPKHYKGLHGVAILSRFPLENVRLVPFKEQPYDWYKTEKNGASPLEKGKRLLSKKIFLEKTTREVRRGGRTTLLADIVDARLPGGRVTIAATHLENRTKPAGRVKQMAELLHTIKNINHPVVIAGDMNTSTTDLTPISLKRMLMQRFGSARFWAESAASYLLGFGFIQDSLKFTVGFGRKQGDPTVRHIPYFSPNPGRKFFSMLKKFRFDDGKAFDFRGDPNRSTGNRGKTLSASNERANKGFVTTYQVERPIAFIGKNKLDWIFVKPANLTDPTDRQQPYLFAPHFGRTLTEINEIGADRISDHHPLLVDLPLTEPLIEKD